MREPHSPPTAPVASVRYAALDHDLQALILLIFLWRFAGCFIAIAGPLFLLDWGLRHTGALAAPGLLPALHVGECTVLAGAVLAALVLAFRWHHQSTFGPYEIQFVSRGGSDLYPTA